MHRLGHGLRTPLPGRQLRTIAVQPLAETEDSRQHIIGDILYTVATHIGHRNPLLARRCNINPVVTAAIDRDALAAFQLFNGLCGQRHIDLRQDDIGAIAKCLQILGIIIGRMAYLRPRQLPGQHFFLHFIVRPFLIDDPDELSSHSITPSAVSGCHAPHRAQPASRPALFRKIPVPCD